MPYKWPGDTDFALWELDVLDRDCPACGRMMHICDHRYRRLHTLEGPVQLVCKLNHCPDRDCPGHAKTKSPEQEATIAPPSWAIGWDVFCWIGHRRCSRHMSIPHIQSELLDDYAIKLSDDAIAKYIQRYQVMLAARQQDPEALRRQYESVDEIVLSIDGLQPEKGHETLYVVRELTQKRVWFAEALISATNDEVQRLIAKAKEWATSLNKTVSLWISDKQDAFVKGIAAEFPDVPHRYCDNHFLRDLAKPVLEADSHAKVQMRRKVRGLRKVEQAVLKHQNAEASTSLAGDDPDGNHDRHRGAGESAFSSSRFGKRGGARLLRGGTWNSQRRSGRPPPSTRPANGRGLEGSPPVDPTELGREKRGFEEKQLGRLADCIDRGLEHVQAEQEPIREYVKDLEKVAATLEVGGESSADRQEKFKELIDQFERDEDPIRQHMATLMISFLAGLFVGAGKFEEIKDNLDLERWFRLPKSHERRIHGHRHAGVRIVQDGPTLLLALDAHAAHPGPFTAADLLPYRTAREPPCQREALNRRKIMRKARSKKKRPLLLAELEKRYRETPNS